MTYPLAAGLPDKGCHLCRDKPFAKWHTGVGA